MFINLFSTIHTLKNPGINPVGLGAPWDDDYPKQSKVFRDVYKYITPTKVKYYVMLINP